MYLSAVKPYLRFNSCSTLYPCISPSLKSNHIRNNVRLSVSSKKSDLKPEHSHNGPHSKPKEIPQHQRSGASQNQVKEESDSKVFPSTIPKKPRRGRRSEAAAVEDFMRDSLERTFASIREQNSEVMMDKEQIMKEKIDDSVESDDAYEGNEESVKSKKMVVEEDNPDWPLDADVGWGIRASDYFEKHAIKNVVGEDGVEIDWEGEIDDNWVKEINCLEWETFAFHPSPLIVLVFERYNRATDNWKVLKELEKATKVYWRAKDRLPPRAVKVDINIERDMAYALKVKEGPQVLFLRGNRILYREKEFRTADELVQMIAHFYYKAKKPSCMT
ncbi:thioredoxin-like fold domain-containing protein MRL7 homolog, chloroplastic isoform X2 [Apium graveolens]|uniref:thioredoxin-like fold domain-containing protein MRL7 homolog, chloroplastic isoform X2 n=1 Tax=Apium graveolens TaxID=4045 RepID=UPI003D79553A